MTWNPFNKKSGKTPPPSLKVGDFLNKKTILFFNAGPSKKQVLGSLIGALDLPDPALALKSILLREEAGSTVIAPGLALPHARIQGIRKIKVAIGISAGGVVDPAVDQPIHVFVLFLGPTDNMREHLAFLAGASALFQSEGLLKELTHLKNSQTVIDKLKQTESSLQ